MFGLHLASQLNRAANGGTAPSTCDDARSIGANNTNMANCNNRECIPIPININNDSATCLAG